MSLKKHTFEIADKVFEYENVQDHLNIQSALGDYKLSWDESSSLRALNEVLSKNPNNVLLIDERVYQLYKDQIQHPPERMFKAEASESFKTLDGIIRVLEFLQDLEFTKAETLVVVGGGIIQDVGAFVAACFKRGISWVYFPTTLLSMCDSCIGAKSSINFHEAKNQLGVFYAPSEIIIIPQFLDSLQEKDIHSGLGEALKLFILAGEQALQQYSALVKHGRVISKQAYKELILTALSIKKSVIEVDEFDHQYRKALNYGHTLGHAIESLSHYVIPHGVAVVLGIVGANQLSLHEKLLLADQELKVRQLCFDLLSKEILNTFKSIDMNQVLDLLKKDKKASGVNLSFIMLANPGKTVFVRFPLSEKILVSIKAAFQAVLV